MTVKQESFLAVYDFFDICNFFIYHANVLGFKGNILCKQALFLHMAIFLEK